MPEPSLQPGTVLAERYRIERQLGQGGMATVFLAEDLKLERQVALKVLRPELGLVLGSERFLAEVKITARLDHPHILTLIDSGNVDGLLYYVLPYVRGESLRDLLDRESQLSVEQSLTIAKHVASALDYAHRNGIVHRDIKPENILLQEGEAMLADFGIALAVQESGGGRLTETGLSLGTPFYMSPEQATGERNLDARSDLYSLASVLYEMLVGEPPMTGKTTQAVIAKLLAEPAMHIRTVRPNVPEAVDAAVARALSKVPADRFASVTEFVRALDAKPMASTASTAAAMAAPPTVNRNRKPMVIGAATAVVVIGVVGSLAARGTFSPKDTSATLRDRAQLTFSGNVSGPALSYDGKQLAFATRSCKAADCRYAIEVQDVGSTNSRKVLEGANSVYGLTWSEDRRNLLMAGTISGRYGSYLVSTLGGTARFVAPSAASFYAGGDSLLIGSTEANVNEFVVRVAGLDGTVRDSVRVPGPGTSLASLVPIPGSTRFVALVIQGAHGLWQVVSRDGKVSDKLLNSCTCGAVASRDALWMTRAGPTAAEAVVRVALDPPSGKFAAHQDTIYSGRFTNLSVTDDGAKMAVDDGSYSYTVFAATVSDLLKGTGGGLTTPLMQASNNVNAIVSPDGSRLLLRRSVPQAKGSDELRFSIMPFGGGAEAPLSLEGNVRGVLWVDSVTVGVHSLTPTGSRFARVDIRTGALTNALAVKDSVFNGVAPIADGWAYIPSSGDRIVIEQKGQRREIKKPAWYLGLTGLSASLDGSQLLMQGWNASTADTMRISVVSTSGETPVAWWQSFAETGASRWLSDGSVLFFVWSGTDAVTLHKVRGPGQETSLGQVAHIATTVSTSADAQRATIMSRESRGDAWIYTVVKPQK